MKYLILVCMVATFLGTGIGIDSYVYAQNNGGFLNPLGNKTVIDIFKGILAIIMVFAVPIVTFFIVFAGFKYVTAQGNETKLQEATKALTYAVIGGVIVLGAWVILEIITTTINAFKN